jgi:hypothetical protein
MGMAFSREGRHAPNRGESIRSPGAVTPDATVDPTEPNPSFTYPVTAGLTLADPGGKTAVLTRMTSTGTRGHGSPRR